MKRLLGVLFIAQAVFAQTDPLEGKWLGIAGPAGDTTEIGFEVRRGADGKLESLVYEPILNMFGQPITMTRDGDTVKVVEFGATLKLDGDRLEGTFSRLNYPMTLRRTTALPKEQPIPDLPKGPAPLWSTKLGGTIYAPVATRDGVAYVGTTGGVMNAVNTSTGKFVWTYSAGRPLHGEALPTGDALYFVCDDGFLHKLNRADGKLIWKYDLGDVAVGRVVAHPVVYDWDYMGPKPVIADDVVYVGSGDGSMHAVNAVTGQRIWRFASKGKVRADALVEGQRVIFGSLDNGVYALNRATGEQLWRQETRAPVTSTPAMIDGKVVVGNRGAGLLALNPENGEIAWRSIQWGSWVESTAVPYGDSFYIGASDMRRTTRYNPKDGHVIWRTDVYGWNWGRPLVTEKTVYVGAAGGSPYFIRHAGSLTALDRATGKIVWRWPYPPDNAHQWGFPAGPALEGSTLVIAALDGTLYGFPAALAR
jgi:outer membrane protein assembly factor BamB